VPALDLLEAALQGAGVELAAQPEAEEGEVVEGVPRLHLVEQPEALLDERGGDRLAGAGTGEDLRPLRPPTALGEPAGEESPLLGREAGETLVQLAQAHAGTASSGA
jgi:hypothetical protein